jgi:hypothetical protein
MNSVGIINSSIDTTPVMADEGSIPALKSHYIINSDRNIIETLDGSVQADIVVNIKDKAEVNEENSETKKLLNEEREAQREMYFRQARVLYPEKEEWCLSLAIEAYLEQLDKGIDILTHKFGEKDVEKY